MKISSKKSMVTEPYAREKRESVYHTHTKHTEHEKTKTP